MTKWSIDDKLKEIKPPKDGAAPPKLELSEMVEQTLTLVREIAEHDRAQTVNQRLVEAVGDAYLKRAAEGYGLSPHSKFTGSLADIMRASCIVAPAGAALFAPSVSTSPAPSASASPAPSASVSASASPSPAPEAGDED